MARKLFLYILLPISLLLALSLWALPDNEPIVESPVKESIRIPNLEISDTPEERTQGLSGRRSLEPGYGMLFVFEENDVYGIWMKDMYIPIDVIWLSDDGQIIGIEHSVQPNTYPKVFYPPRPVRYVLETAAGTALMSGWEVGNRIQLP